MSKNIKPSNTEVVNFRINADMIKNLKILARHVSFYLNEDYSYVDIIRCLLAEHFPVPEDNNMASEQIKKVENMCSRITKQSAIAGIPKIPSTFTTSTMHGNTTTFSHKSDSIITIKAFESDIQPE